MIIKKVKDKEYKLRLNLEQIYELELREQKSILKLFNDVETVSMIAPLVKILQAALLEYQPETTIKDAFAFYEGLVEAENFTIEKLGELIEELFEKSGLSLGK